MTTVRRDSVAWTLRRRPDHGPSASPLTARVEAALGSLRRSCEDAVHRRIDRSCRGTSRPSTSDTHDGDRTWTVLWSSGRVARATARHGRGSHGTVEGATIVRRIEAVGPAESLTKDRGPVIRRHWTVLPQCRE